MKVTEGKSYVSFTEVNGEMVAHDLFVDPSQRGEKLGYKLLGFAKEYALNSKMDLILYAESEEKTMSNKNLISYYEGCGFESDEDCSKVMLYKIKQGEKE